MVKANLVNSGKLLPSKVGDNPDLSLRNKERATTIERVTNRVEYTQVSGSARSPEKDYDIV